MYSHIVYPVLVALKLADDCMATGALHPPCYTKLKGLILCILLSTQS